MSNHRFTPRQLRFLELFFSGYKMKNAAARRGLPGRQRPESLQQRKESFKQAQ